MYTSLSYRLRKLLRRKITSESYHVIMFNLFDQLFEFASTSISLTRKLRSKTNRSYVRTRENRTAQALQDTFHDHQQHQRHQQHKTSEKISANQKQPTFAVVQYDVTQDRPDYLIKSFRTHTNHVCVCLCVCVVVVVTTHCSSFESFHLVNVAN